MDVLTLIKSKPQTLKSQFVTAVLLALGSNYQAESYFPQVHHQLALLGQIKSSSAFQNPDFTASSRQPKPDYINQCVHLSLTAPTTLQQLQKIFKSIEQDCHRCRQSALIAASPVAHVTMDIDILMIKVMDTQDWIVMADRYPFKAHERAGVKEIKEFGLL